MQESSSQLSEIPESVEGFSELDLAIVDALQTDPRAPWTRVGRAVGVDPTTAARRWERMVDEGLAWVTGYRAPSTCVVAYLELSCRTGAIDRLCSALAHQPWLFTVEHVVGDCDLTATAVAPDLPTLGRQISGVIGAMRGVQSVRTHLALRFYREGRDWHVRALEPGRRAVLGAPRTQLAQAPSAHGGTRSDDADTALLDALGLDGRAAVPALSARSGIGESTVRRRLARWLQDDAVRLRCDVAQPLAGLSTTAGYRAVVPHGELTRIGTELARIPEIRLCASVTGPANLLFAAWLADLDSITRLESLLDERFPMLKVQDRQVSLRAVKRMGRLLDDHGRALNHVPIAMPLPANLSRR